MAHNDEDFRLTRSAMYHNSSQKSDENLAEWSGDVLPRATAGNHSDKWTKRLLQFGVESRGEFYHFNTIYSNLAKVSSRLLLNIEWIRSLAKFSSSGSQETPISFRKFLIIELNIFIPI